MRKKSLNFKKHRGITLIELLIYLAITTIVLVVVIDLVARIAQNRSASRGQTEATQNARFLSERLTYAIQSASTATGEYPADILNLTVNGGPIVFTLQDGQILYEENLAAALALTDQNVEISAIGPDESIFNKIVNGNMESIQIRFKITFKETSFSRQFQTAVLLRGK